MGYRRGVRRVHYETTCSTNDQAKRLAGEGCALPLVVTAGVQEGGRGRMGRRWDSPMGGVWVSFGWETSREIRETGAMGMVLALGVVGAVEKVAPVLGGRLRIKWPNDVLVDGKKICGVLCERLGGGAGGVVIGGVGVNGDFGVKELAEEVRGGATTLRDVVGGSVDVEVMRDAVVAGVWERVEMFEAHGLREADRAEIEGMLAMRGEDVRIEVTQDRVIEGRLAGIGADGSAVIERGGERVMVRSGEVVRARRSGVDAN